MMLRSRRKLIVGVLLAILLVSSRNWFGSIFSASSNKKTLGTCSNGHVGNGICEDQAECCSEWGYCGDPTEFNCTDSSNEGTCGGGDRGNGICPRMTRECCSADGYCGTTEEHCRDPTLGFCNWGEDGTADTATCDEPQGGDWCNRNQEACENGCFGHWCPL